MNAQLERDPSLPKTGGIWVALAVASICLLVGLAVTAHVSGLVQDVVAAQHQQRALAKLSEGRTRLEGHIEAATALGKGMRGYVIQDHLTQEEFAKFSAELIDDVPYIRSVGLAPDNILQYLYPFEGNEKAIGLNYRNNSAQWPAIEEAMRTRSTVIDGPIELVQGGRALMLRVPVFPPKFPGEALDARSYWGVATLVVDEEALITASGLAIQVDGYRIAMVSRMEPGLQPTLLFGDAELLALESVSLPLVLAGARQWEILAFPVGGWALHSEEVWLSRIFGGLISVIFAAMAFMLVYEVYKVRTMALYDPLTGLANRRLLEDRMNQLAALSDRNGDGFEIYYIDLDAFKPINDTYGHAVGDQVLIEIGHRLKTQTRQTDTVARVGGDEFVVMTSGTMNEDSRNQFLMRMRKQVNKEIEYPGVRIAISASVGFASYPAEATDIEKLMRIADTRMYNQKSAKLAKPLSSAVSEAPG
jgi:diguanylate cyclase (GGDEF)-like protein